MAASRSTMINSYVYPLLFTLSSSTRSPALAIAADVDVFAERVLMYRWKWCSRRLRCVLSGDASMWMGGAWVYSLA